MKKIFVVSIIVVIAFSLIATRGCPFSKQSKDKKTGSSGISEWSIPAPSNLIATAIGYSRINLSFQDNSNNEDGFEVYRSTSASGGNYSLLSTLNADTTTYSDPPDGEAGTGLTPGVTYYYRIRAYNTIGDYSGYSNIASVSLQPADWLALSAGESHSLALAADGSAQPPAGTLWGWGNNFSGQLDPSNYEETITRPTLLNPDTDWSIIAAGYYHTLSIKTAGTLWSWGDNTYGQLGLGDMGFYDEPTRVGTDYDWSVVVGGSNHSLSLKTDGTIWSWGLNEFGQLGLGNSGIGTERNTPTQIGTDSDWTLIAAGASHNLAIKTNKILWAWGWNEVGQLGTGLELDDRGDLIPKSKSIPTQVGTDSDWLAVSAGYTHTIALKTGGTLYQWGTNAISIPTQIGTDTDWADITAGGTIEGSTLFYHNLTLKIGGTLWAWGWAMGSQNNYGQLGLGDNLARSTPTQVSPPQAGNWVVVAAGGCHSLACTNDGTLWVWGRNQYGQLGLRDTVNRNIPYPLGSLAIPSSLNATVISSSQINLSWVDNSSNETGFRIERRYDGSASYIQIDTVSPDVTLYSDTTVTPGNSYYYQVRAYNDLGDSPASNEAEGISFVVAPSSLTATASSSSQIDLVWTDVNGKADYKIERKIEAGGSYQQIATVSNIHLYSDTPLTPLTTYYYRVRAYNASGDSAYSPVASATTPEGPPGAPALLIAHLISPTRIDLEWTDVSSELGYKIGRSFGAPGYYEEIATVGADTTIYSDTTVTPSNTYYYRVWAYNSSGDGPYSDETYTGTTPLRPLSGEDTLSIVSETTMMTAGYRFSSGVNGKIIALGRYAGGSGGNTTVILWDDTDTELGRVTVLSDTGWQWANLSTPISITAETVYRVSVSCPTTFWLGAFPSSPTQGNITIIETCLADGVLDEFPYINCGSGEMYGWADIAFVAE